MFKQPFHSSQLPILRNPPTSPIAASSTINGTINGDSSPFPMSPPFLPLQILQPSPAFLAEIYRTPHRAIVQVLAYQLLHEGEFKYIKNGPTVSILDSIELINPVVLPGKTPIPSQRIRFNIREIQAFNFIRSARSSRSSTSERKRRPEIDPDQPVQLRLNTFVVQTAVQFKNFAQVMHDVDVCGISLEGENVCRHGNVSWIILGVKKTLVPLDIVSLSQVVPNLWETLKKAVFENRKLIKIFHDCRPAADYLSHKHDIKLSNVFDTQVADAFVAKNTTGFHPSELKSLSDVLQLYSTRIPTEELDYLKNFDKKDYKQNSPWMTRPLPDQQYLKYGALKVKHLVPLRDNLMKKLLEKFARAVASQIEIYNQTDFSFPEQNPFALPSSLESILDEELPSCASGSG